MSWNKSVFTNAGTDMMSEVLSGATMTITKATGGSGTTEEASLATLTDVQEEKQTLKILGIEDASDSTGNDAGKRIKIQITNGDVDAGYILHQVGVYAKLADGDETLLFIMQDDRGVEIPSHTENSDFVIELFGVMAISNVANIKVTVDPSAVASVKMVNEQVVQVNTKIDKTKEDLQKEAQETYLPLSGGTLTGPLVMPGGGETVSIVDNAATHNMVYRGKALGTTVTSEQWAAIKAGTFKDLYLGDYWTIGGVDYMIAAFNYWLNCGDTACTANHLLVVPRNNMYTGQMNSTNITTGGYVGSEMYKTGLAQAKTAFNNAFGSAHILNHREYLTNAITNGAPTGTDWYDSTVELMNENMVYGGRQFSPMPNGATDPWNTCRNYTIDKSQLPLFHLAPWLICNRSWYWLRDVVSAANFANVDSDGNCDCGNASNTSGVRPVAGLIG
nr:MAG TPA: tail-collar fiber protein [Caudoviricetes sp.]